MIISSEGVLLKSEGFQLIESEKNRYYYRGVIFAKNKKAGVETVRFLIEEYETKGKVPFEEIYGAFSFVIDEGEKVTLFTDNSNMHCFYYADNAVSSSFLSLLEYENSIKTVLKYSLQSVCEQLTLGKIYFGKTAIEGIFMSDAQNCIVIKKNKISLVSKGLQGIEGKSSLNKFEDLFQIMSYAFDSTKVTQGLTGGYDSRTVFACLNNQMKITPFISGDNKRSVDIQIAARVAKISNSKLKIVETKKPLVTEELLEKLFRKYDGVKTFANSSTYRIYDFSVRNQKKYNIQLTGDGGVLHKDWEWMQDLPFYNKKSTNIKKFYHQRIAFDCHTYGLSDQIKKIYNRQESRFIQKLNDFKMGKNTESYDSLYYYVTGRRSIDYNLPNWTLVQYAPLLELDLVRYSYHLPRRKRFFNNNLREVITRNNIAIARFPTIYGTTASSEGVFIARDVFFQVIDYLKKAFRMIGRVLFKRTFFCDNVITWSIEDDIKKLPVTQEALSYCIKREFMNKEIKIEQLTNMQVCSILYLYYIGKTANI